MQLLVNDAAIHVSSFLDPFSLISLEGVSSQWQRVLTNESRKDNPWHYWSHRWQLPDTPPIRRKQTKARVAQECRFYLKKNLKKWCRMCSLQPAIKCKRPDDKMLCEACQLHPAWKIIFLTDVKTKYCLTDNEAFQIKHVEGTNRMYFSPLYFFMEKDVIEFCASNRALLKPRLLKNRKRKISSIANNANMLSFFSFQDSVDDYWTRCKNDQTVAQIPLIVASDSTLSSEFRNEMKDRWIRHVKAWIRNQPMKTKADYQAIAAFASEERSVNIDNCNFQVKQNVSQWWQKFDNACQTRWDEQISAAWQSFIVTAHEHALQIMKAQIIQSAQDIEACHTIWMKDVEDICPIWSLTKLTLGWFMCNWQQVWVAYRSTTLAETQKLINETTLQNLCDF